MKMNRKQFCKNFFGGIIGLGSIAMGIESANDNKTEPLIIYQNGSEPTGTIYHTPDQRYIKIGKGEEDWMPLDKPVITYRGLKMYEDNKHGVTG